jgi:exonuclease SbcC
LQASQRPEPICNFLKVRLDTIYIDEGFGSLDAENGTGKLDLGLRVIGNLVREHRDLGFICHAPLGQEAITNSFHAQKSASGSRLRQTEIELTILANNA